MSTASEQAKEAGLKNLAEVAERQKPKASHWYCAYCEQQLNERDVTLNQRHAYCRNVAKWVEVG